MHRLHRSLLRLGVDSKILVLEGEQLGGGDPAPRSGDIVIANPAAFLQRMECNQNRCHQAPRALRRRAGDRPFVEGTESQGR